MEAFLNRFLNFLLFIFILSPINQSFASAKVEIPSGNNLIEIPVSRKEINLADNFKQLYKLVNKGIVNQKLLKKFHKDIKKVKALSILRPWSSGILKISKRKGLKNIRSLCQKYTPSPDSNKIKEHLKENIYQYCITKYLDRLKVFSYKELKFHSKNLLFFKKHIASIYVHSKTKDLTNFYQSLKKNNQVHKAYSSALLTYIKASMSIPKESLLEELYLSSEDTKYFQERDLSESNTRYVFYNELLKLKRRAFSLVDIELNKIDKPVAFAAYDDVIKYYENTKKLLPLVKAHESILSLSKSYMRRGFHQQAQKGYGVILKAKDSTFSETLFESTWSFIEQGEYNVALKNVKSVISDEKFLDEDPRLNFWVGYLNDKLGNEEDSSKNFINTIKNNPLSYYSILSAKMLSQTMQLPANKVYLQYLSKTTEESPNKLSVNKNFVKRGTLWGAVYLPKFLNLELANLNNIKSKELVEHNLMSLANNLSHHKQYLESFKIIYKSIKRHNINLTKNVISILFPRPYFNQIKNHSDDFDPIIALSLIRQESGFNNRARSHVGARGLMQLMPSTARQFKKRLKNRHLYNPKLNIKIGTQYFKNLLEQYDNNLVYSLAAYNAGERRVNEWQQDYLTSDFMLNNIENIPFNETRKYVKLIFRNIFFYKLLFSDDRKDSDSLNQIYDIHLGFKS